MLISTTETSERALDRLMEVVDRAKALIADGSQEDRNTEEDGSTPAPYQ